MDKTQVRNWFKKLDSSQREKFLALFVEEITTWKEFEKYVRTKLDDNWSRIREIVTDLAGSGDWPEIEANSADLPPKPQSLDEMVGDGDKQLETDPENVSNDSVGDEEQDQDQDQGDDEDTPKEPSWLSKVWNKHGGLIVAGVGITLLILAAIALIMASVVNSSRSIGAEESVVEAEVVELAETEIGDNSLDLESVIPAFDQFADGNTVLLWENDVNIGMVLFPRDEDMPAQVVPVYEGGFTLIALGEGVFEGTEISPVDETYGHVILIVGEPKDSDTPNDLNTMELVLEEYTPGAVAIITIWAETSEEEAIEAAKRAIDNLSNAPNCGQDGCKVGYFWKFEEDLEMVEKKDLN